MTNHPNRSNLYTVLSCDGDVMSRHLTVAEAAYTVMQYDGHDFEIEKSADGRSFDLWTTQFSRNSPAAGWPLTKSVIFSLATDKATAEAEIFKQVIDHADWWRGCDVVLDKDYDEMLAKLAVEEAESESE